MGVSLRNFAVAVLVCGVALAPAALACGPKKDCASCLTLDRVKQATENAGKIEAFLATKKCEKWKGLTFKMLAISVDGVSSCRTFTGLPYVQNQQPKCSVAEDLELSVGEKVSAVAGTSVIDDLARDGQLECEPDGTMLFNRGPVRFSELDSLYPPILFRPSGFGYQTPKVVGLEVVLSSKLTNYRNSKPEHWCHDANSAVLIFYDIANKKGVSVLSEST